MRSIRRHLWAFLCGILLYAGTAWADPPTRVARLGYVYGPVSFQAEGANDWVQGSINRPLTSGDRLWTDAAAWAEIQFGGTIIQMAPGTGAALLNLDDRIAQVQLTQGSLNVRVRRLAPRQSVEVDTPNLAFTLRQAGEYRITVAPDGGGTLIVVRKGQGEAYSDNTAFVIDSRVGYRFTAPGLRDYQTFKLPPLDEFDRWSLGRDRNYDQSASARYVSQDVVGFQDLDGHGRWATDPTYGTVWTPAVPADWAPYRDGHWAWIAPWGWTWVDDAPWGYAVSHYGRWANLHGRWAWVPGPLRTPAYYAPALVAFVGGENFQVTSSAGRVKGVAWFPLAPREIYRPAYPVSRAYFENINHSNMAMDKGHQAYDQHGTPPAYANRQVQGAVIAVAAAAFMQSQAVSRAAVPLPRDMHAGGPVAFAPLVAHTAQNLHGAAPQGKVPPPQLFQRPVIARSPATPAPGKPPEAAPHAAPPHAAPPHAAPPHAAPPQAVPGAPFVQGTPQSRGPQAHGAPIPAPGGRPADRKPAERGPTPAGAPAAPAAPAIPAIPAVLPATPPSAPGGRAAATSAQPPQPLIAPAPPPGPGTPGVHGNAEQHGRMPPPGAPTRAKDDKPAAAKPADAKPAPQAIEIKPAIPPQIRPAEVKPAAATQPAEIKPAVPPQAKPAELKPASAPQAKPAAAPPAKPVEIKPGVPPAARPAEVKPVVAPPAKPAAAPQAKPAEVRPAVAPQARPAEIKPPLAPQARPVKPAVTPQATPTAAPQARPSEARPRPQPAPGESRPAPEARGRDAKPHGQEAQPGTPRTPRAEARPAASPPPTAPKPPAAAPKAEPHPSSQPPEHKAEEPKHEEKRP